MLSILKFLKLIEYWDRTSVCVNIYRTYDSVKNIDSIYFEKIYQYERIFNDMLRRPVRFLRSRPCHYYIVHLQYCETVELK